MTTVSQMARETLNFFMKETKALAKESGFVKRRSKLTGFHFVQTLVVGFLQEPRISLEGLCELLDRKKVRISKQGLHERFNAASVKLLSRLLARSLEIFRQKQRMPFEILNCFQGVELLDSSGISLPLSLKDIYPGCGGAASEAGLKIQTLWDYGSGGLSRLDITSARKPDQGYRGHLEEIKKGCLYVADLGYFCCESFQKIVEQKAYFISRFLTITQIFDKGSQQKIELVSALKSEKNQLEFSVLLGKDYQIPVRLIALRAPKAVAEKRRRDMNREAKKQGRQRSQASLALADWSIYVTNVEEDQLSADQVSIVYRVRWQIELLYKLWKSEAGIDQIVGKKSARVLCEIYAKLIAIVLLLYLTLPCHWHVKQELSYRKAFHTLRKDAMTFFDALGSLWRLKKFLCDIQNRWNKFSLKEPFRKTKKSTFQRLVEAANPGVIV